MPTRNRPPNRGSQNKPSTRGSFAPKPQPYQKGPGGKATKHRSSPPPPPTKKRCCSMVAAFKAYREGDYRLAARYASYSVHAVKARLL